MDTKLELQKTLLKKEIEDIEKALESRRRSSISQSPPSNHSEVKRTSPLSSGSRALAQKAWRERHEAERMARALALAELESRAVEKVKLKHAQALRKATVNTKKNVNHNEYSTPGAGETLSLPSIGAESEGTALEAAVVDLNNAIEESRVANLPEILKVKTLEEDSDAEFLTSNERNDNPLEHFDLSSVITNPVNARWDKIKTNLSNVVLSSKEGFNLDAITATSQNEIVISKNNETTSQPSLSSIKFSINLDEDDHDDDEELISFVPTPSPSPPPPPPTLSYETILTDSQRKRARSFWAVVRRNLGNITLASQGNFDLEKISSSPRASETIDEEDSASVNSARTDEILALLP
jgi:hypothetical protein